MDFLEEFMPGMGDVLDAQEGALMAVVATLSTQMQQLLVTNERQAQRVAQLESTQFALRCELKEMQDAPAPAPVVVEVPAPPDPAVAEAVAILSTKMQQLQQDVQQQVTEQMQQALSVFSTATTADMDELPARMLLEAQVRALDQKVTTEIGELRGEAAESLAERTKLTEEAFKDQIEQIEKRFDYLLGVKMEVKELTRRADRHEKSLDDVRTAIEVLAKSLGTDDVDSESNDESEETLEEALEKPVESEPSMYSARRISLRSAPRSRSVALPIADAVPEEIEAETTKEDPVPRVDVLVLTRDSAKDIISSAETPHTDDIEVIEPTPQISELIQDAEEELIQLIQLNQFPLILLSQLNLLLKSLSQKQRMNSSLRSAITALDEAIVELQPLADKVEKLERAHKTQARVIVDVEEKIQELSVEVQRLRTSSHRNNSMNSNVTTAVTSAISAQLQDVSSKFTHHLATFQTTEKIMVEVSETEIPALHDKIELSLYTLRQEAEQRASEATLEVQKLFDQLQTSQRSADGNLVLRITEFCNRIYRTLLGMSDAMLRSVELSKIEQTIKKTARAPLDVGIELLQRIFTHFTTNCKALISVETESEIDFLVEAAVDFQQQLEKLKGQAAIAKAATQSFVLDVGSNDNTHGNNSTPIDTSQNSSFCDHLVFITTAKLKELEKALITQTSNKVAGHAPELTLHLNDVVVQMRSVLFLLLLHAETMDSRNQAEDLRSSQGLIQNKVVEHGFAIGQLESIGAVVKLMNSRLDTFIEYSFAYAKEEDVKKSIEELMTANNEMRDLVTNSLEATRSETLERDGLLGEEMNQLIARVSKKLDKDELLWTQEVLERQVQNVANASLDEHDLVDIHRRLRRKVDKNQLKSLLVDQSGGMGSSSGTRLANSTSGTEDDGQKTPLVGTKCISCQGELPPTKAMIKNAVREEVQQEIAKSRAHKSPSSLPTFNVSNHRSLEAFKKELLLSALQQQKPSSK
ncbi:hypothetical protein BBO99_00007879 [Phytophthora kernoviae]|uniref:Uncharacterized protein n=2 Tax=Phytophthora kernoviae TaxID=325452 RepID=A0A3R7GSM0_9STRA|nr:hypothetical protein G195_009348 [Phytophthora kernoviae 00238/432]KAG2523490.1 hypothetical protein JM16_002280 [Phytophthora kernoviae]KAG2525427.1 hypothetical protein JM18_002332 [Phytophthora kernoviae]RLN37974.1 hypothetical protein BBI17_007837 [Phytophthora kernoviae]RLN76025.1 hypothetical protein BBO99_00007879 [Phytophthora kernoviae]